MTVMTRRRCPAILAVLVLLMAMVSGLVQPALAHADGQGCPAQVAALDDNQARIAEHNARGGGPGPPEIVIPYNREAAQLNAEKDALVASLQACQLAIGKLRDNGPAPKALKPTVLSDLGKAAAAARPQWTSPTPPVKLGDGRVTVPKDHALRPVWDVVKNQVTPLKPYPNVPLQGERRPSVGDSHPSGYTVGSKPNGAPAVSADHIVPKVEILYLPRFLELTPENMWEVLNAASNLQWLPSEVNTRNKNSKSAADMQDVDPDWQKEQVALQDRKRRELTDMIAQLADSQLPKP